MDSVRSREVKVGDPNRNFLCGLYDDNAFGYSSYIQAIIFFTVITVVAVITVIPWLR